MSDAGAKLNPAPNARAITAAEPVVVLPGREMTTWRRWVHQPQRIWLRRALFQIHLWVGIALGLYIVMISITGAALVYRRELSVHYSRKPVLIAVLGPRMSSDQLRQVTQRLHPDYYVDDVYQSTKLNQPYAIVLVRGNARVEHLVNPYNGADLGDPLSGVIHAIEWTADLHDNLLGGQTGRAVNGVGSILATVLALTGIVIWWPGIKNWRRALSIAWKARFARLNWDLHSALGFWCLLFILMWGVSGVYLAFPRPFNAFFDFVAPPGPDTDISVGDRFLGMLAQIHFGRYGLFLETIWALIGLVPAILFVTGLLMWWNRVLRKGPRIPE